MIQLTSSLQWDSSKLFGEQEPEVQNYINNVIATFDKQTTKEAIHNSDFYRVLTARYLGNGYVVEESFEYIEPVNGSGWNAIKSIRINCYAK